MTKWLLDKEIVMDQPSQQKQSYSSRSWKNDREGNSEIFRAATPITSEEGKGLRGPVVIVIWSLSHVWLCDPVWALPGALLSCCHLWFPYFWYNLHRVKSINPKAKIQCICINSYTRVKDNPINREINFITQKLLLFSLLSQNCPLAFNPLPLCISLGVNYVSPRILHKFITDLYFFFVLTFAWYIVLEIHTCFCLYQYFIPFYFHKVLHNMDLKILPS